MKTLILLCISLITVNLHAALPDLTGNYTGCGVSTSSGKVQVVLSIVKMPTGFGKDDFRYNGGFSVLGLGGAPVVSDFFIDVKIDEPTLRILMLTEVNPVRDFGKIAKSVTAQMLADGSMTGETLANSSGGNAMFQQITWAVKTGSGSDSGSELR